MYFPVRCLYLFMNSLHWSIVPWSRKWTWLSIRTYEITFAFVRCWQIAMRFMPFMKSVSFLNNHGSAFPFVHTWKNLFSPILKYSLSTIQMFFWPPQSFYPIPPGPRGGNIEVVQSLQIKLSYPNDSEVCCAGVAQEVKCANMR